MINGEITDNHLHFSANNWSIPKTLHGSEGVVTTYDKLTINVEDIRDSHSPVSLAFNGRGCVYSNILNTQIRYVFVPPTR